MGVCFSFILTLITPGWLRAFCCEFHQKPILFPAILIYVCNKDWWLVLLTSHCVSTITLEKNRQKKRKGVWNWSAHPRIRARVNRLVGALILSHFQECWRCRQLFPLWSWKLELESVVIWCELVLKWEAATAYPEGAFRGTDVPVRAEHQMGTRKPLEFQLRTFYCFYASGEAGV